MTFPKTTLLLIPALFLLLALSFFSREVSLSSHAEAIFQKCFSQGDAQTCYDKEIPKLTDFISMEEAFQVIRMVQAQDPSYRYCHVVGHALSAKEYQKNPENWKDIIPRCPYAVCANGCQHGVVQEIFRNKISEFLNDAELEKLKAEFGNVCEEKPNWRPSSFQQGHCYHGLGHLAMYVANADIPKSLGVCDAISLKEDGRDFRSVCYGGLFMQMFQPLEPEDFALVEGKALAKEDAKEFCGNIPGTNLRKEACWLQAWPLFGEELTTAEGIIGFCEEGKSFARLERCYTQLFHILAQGRNYEIIPLKELCVTFPDELKAECVRNVASAIIDGGTDFINLAVDFCHLAKEGDLQEACYKAMVDFSVIKFNPGTENFLKLCNALPPPWDKKCIERAKGYK